jgi:hypothetical protein
MEPAVRTQTLSLRSDETTLLLGGNKGYRPGKWTEERGESIAVA